ncbi:hypothetical protein Pta6605_52380 [Pseudomonas amygdali pv. tabaci]|nr:hypothetical protein Pta6605_52380 [Pseudomonas amygdali pv. tabaci]
MIGGHASFALLIEQLQTGLHNAFTGFGTGCHADKATLIANQMMAILTQADAAMAAESKQHP